MPSAKTPVRSKVPKASSLAARHRMQANRSKDTRPERALRSALHRMGLRFRIHRRPLKAVRRHADIVFGPARVVVFVDGCFWHGCPQHGTQPKANRVFWRDKLETNRRRDADTNERLEAAGWRVVRIWEHEDPAAAARRIERLVRRRRRNG